VQGQGALHQAAVHTAAEVEVDEAADCECLAQQLAVAGPFGGPHRCAGVRLGASHGRRESQRVRELEVDLSLERVVAAGFGECFAVQRNPLPRPPGAGVDCRQPAHDARPRAARRSVRECALE
jgi:hypothetical protein